MDTAKAAGLLESSLSSELAQKNTQLLSPRRPANDLGVIENSPEAIEKTVASFAAHTGKGALFLPMDLTPSRLGPSPPDSYGELRIQLSNSILDACGIPPSLSDSKAPGTSQRESYRRFLHATLRPIGKLIEQELQAKLSESATLEFGELKAGDIASSARAFGTLVTAGVTPKSAAAIVGLDGVEVREEPA